MRHILTAILLIAASIALVFVLSHLGLGFAAACAFGGMFLLGGWQLASGAQAKRQYDALLVRVHRAEQHAKAMEDALKDTRHQMQDMAGKLDGKNQNVVAELKLLQTLLRQVVQKNININRDLAEEIAGDASDLAARAKPRSKSPKAAPAPDVDPDADMVLASEAIDTPTAMAAAAKQPVRGQIRLIKREAQLLEVIQSALSENRVDLYLQPVVGLPARKTRHFECLSRVRDEEGRIILPRHYMKVAEAKGLVGTIDNLLLFRLIQLVRRLGPRRPDMRFFCNLSAHNAQDPEFFPQFIDFMQAQDEFTDRLVFEISQADYAILSADVRAQLGRLGKRGFRFSMEDVNDFGFDLVELRRQKFGFIKADMTAMTDHLSPAAIRELVNDARRHEIALVASRVEHENHVLEAQEATLEYAQGYHFSEPKPADHFAKEF